MERKIHTKLIKQLRKLAPSTPSVSMGKSRSNLINELFQLAPEKPIKRVSGIELVKQLNIPSSPNQKK